jgi:DNA polymerase III alpha subunit (gram-positive type)
MENIRKSKFYIALDVETGGIGLDKSLLTAYFLVLDENGDMLTDLSLALKPDDGVYRVTAQALGINGINLIEHDKIAITYTEAAKKLYEFLKYASQEGKIKLIPVGHHISFDLDQINDKLLSKPTWENFVSYRLLDTGSVAQFLISCGKLDGTKTTGSMESLCKYFNVTHETLGFKDARLHNAEYDTRATVKVLECMADLLD